MISCGSLYHVQVHSFVKEIMFFPIILWPKDIPSFLIFSLRIRNIVIPSLMKRIEQGKHRFNVETVS